MTPLHWASEQGHYHVAKLLLKNGADPNALSKFEKTPLDIADDNDHCDLIDLLHVSIIQMTCKTQFICFFNL